MQNPRQQKIAESAVRVLAKEGARGLAHRAVDREAGLPTGSTSYYANSRMELLRLALTHVMEHDRETFQKYIGPGVGVALEELLEALSAPEEREFSLARFELYLEAARNAEFQKLMEAHRREFIGLAAAALELQGAENPRAEAVALITASEGKLFQTLVFSAADWLEGE